LKNLGCFLKNLALDFSANGIPVFFFVTKPKVNAY